MRFSKFNNKISLTDDIIDALNDNLPESIDNTQEWIVGKEGDKLIDAILNAVQIHVEAQLDGIADKVVE